MKFTRTIIFFTAIFCLFSAGCANSYVDPAQAGYISQAKWQNWVHNLRKDALAQGIRPDLFDRVFADISPQVGLIIRDHKLAKVKGNYYYYRLQRGDWLRIRIGRKEYQQHRALLEEIGKVYQVDPCYIAAIWGIETVYGRYTGNYPVITSLATLAYDTRRSDFFRQELLYALHIVNEGHTSEQNFKGAWDGGMGQPQFMPSSWYKYAVDYDGDGRKDIWFSHADVFASIANYLKQFGWQMNQPYSVEVIPPAKIDPQLLAGDITKPVQEWQAMGIRIKRGQIIPDTQLPAALKQLDGGPAILMFNNFKVILQYNKSKFYAGTVGYLANHICNRK